MNNALTHTGFHLPTVALKSDGGVLILDLSDPYMGDDEPTRVDLRIPMSDKARAEDNWCDGMTLFALFLAFVGACVMCAQGMAEKAERAQRTHLDTTCAVTSR